MMSATVADRAGLAEAWFVARGWQAFDFQREVWDAMAAGRSDLLHATTGSGKTYAVWFGALTRARLVEQAGAEQRTREAGQAQARSASDHSDVLTSLNTGELAQRRFREIAGVAGLVFTGSEWQSVW